MAADASAFGRDLLVEHAPAKVNLTLRVLGRRSDGYHELESLVAFTEVADRLTLEPGGELSLAAEGATAGAAGPLANNLVLKASQRLAACVPGLRYGRFALEKQLPVAAGLGGGSSDAAAALRLLARSNGLARDDARLHAAAVATGADVPVCLDLRVRVMRGIGERLSAPLPMPALPAVLVNPGVALATADVFRMLAAAPPWAALTRPAGAIDEIAALPSPEAIIAALAGEVNDLEPAAIRLEPAVSRTLEALRGLPGCRLARMSGSGATCFGLFASRDDAKEAARALQRREATWWVRETALGAVV